MKVIAIAEGYDNVKVRQPGEVFDMPDGATGEWFKPVDQGDAIRGPKAKKSPDDNA